MCLEPKAFFCFKSRILSRYFMAMPPQSSATVPPLAAAFVQLGRDHEAPFARFLADLEANGDSSFFHPHAFDAETARKLAAISEVSPDEYWLLVGHEVLAYGMLRGWAEGYSLPSLGLAVAPRHRGQGLARAMIYHLHARAVTRGATHVRLKVERDNHTAYRLYQTLGYVFSDHSPTELLGILALADGPIASA